MALVGVLLAFAVAVGALAVYFRLGPRATKPTAAGGQPVAGPTHHGDLRTYLVRPPRGSKPWPRPLGTSRHLSLRQAAALSNDVKTRMQMFTHDHFTHGAVQCWIGTDRSVVDVRLYQFNAVANAQAFYREDVSATSHEYSAPNTSRIRGVPGGWAYSDPRRDSQGFVHVITLAVKGDVVFVVSLAELSRTVNLSLPDSLTQKQYRKL